MRLGISGGILFWIFHRIFEKTPPHQFWQTMAAISPAWMAAAIGLAGLNCLIGIVRWHALLRVQGLSLGWGKTAGIFFIGAFFNTFMLGVTGGDVSKAYYAARETHHKRTEAVITVMVDRLVGLLGMLVFSVSILTFNSRFLLTESTMELRLAALTVLAFMFGVITVMALGFWRSLPKRVRPLGWLLERIPAAIKEILKKAAEAYQVYASHPKVIMRTLLLSVCVHIVATLVTVAIANGLGLTAVSVGTFFLVLPLINCLTAIPITLSGLGMREGLYYVLFGAFGLSREEAVSLSLLYFVAGLVWNLMGGVVFMFWRKKEHLPPPA